MTKANITLSYLYRDGSNYKNHGEVVFANSSEIELNLNPKDYNLKSD